MTWQSASEFSALPFPAALLDATCPDLAFEVHGVPQHDRCGEEVQARCSVALLFEAAVTELAEPVKTSVATRVRVATVLLSFSLPLSISLTKNNSGNRNA